MSGEDHACLRDFVEHTRHLFVDVAQQGDIDTGERPARRAVFRKLHGIAHGVFTLDASRPSAVREGVFAKDGSFHCWVRFSSDVSPDTDDNDNGTNGIAIKIFDFADGPTLASHDPNAGTIDLI